VPLTRRKTIIAALFCVSATLVLLAIIRRDDEPRHDGRSLSAWLALYRKNAMTKDSPDFKKAENAIRAIGTKALPYLLEWIQCEPPQWRWYLLRKLPYRLTHNETGYGFILGRDYIRAWSATRGFWILGTNAAAAVPFLETLMKNQSTPETSRNAALALMSVGSAAVPALTNALADPQQPRRFLAVSVLGEVAHDIGTNVVLPALTNALTDPDALVRMAATNVLRRIAPDVLTNTSAR